MYFSFRTLLAVVCSVCAVGGANVADSNPNPELLMDQGHYKRGRAIVEPAYKANPTDAHLAHLLARAKLMMWDDKGAAILAEKSVTLDPNVPDYHALYARVYGRQLDDAPAFAKVGLLRHFRKELEAALALNPNHSGALAMKAIFLWDAPALLGGDRKKAEELAGRLNNLDGEKGLLYLARYYRQQKNWGRMESVLLKMPRNPVAVAELAYMYCCRVDNPRWKEAEQKAREAIALESTRGLAYAVLGRVMAAQQRWAELDTLIAQTEHASPDDLSAYYEAGVALRMSGADNARGERYLRKYLTVTPEGDAPEHASAHWELGLLLEKMGRRAEAAKELETVLAIRPGWDPVKKDLKRMK